MNKYLIGFLFGAIVASVTVVGAASVTADHTPNIRYWFNDSESPKPAGYTTFTYQDHTYIPARYVAEKLGAEVGWDQQYQIVKFDNTKFTALTEQAGVVKNEYKFATASFVTVKDGKSSLAFVLDTDKDQATTHNAVLEQAGKVASLAVKGKVVPDTVETHIYAKLPEGFLNVSAYIPSAKIVQFSKGEITAADYYASWKLVYGNEPVMFSPDANVLNNAK